MDYYVPKRVNGWKRDIVIKDKGVLFIEYVNPDRNYNIVIEDWYGGYVVRKYHIRLLRNLEVKEFSSLGKAVKYAKEIMLVNP